MGTRSDDRTPLHLTISETYGPLFVICELAEEQDAATRASVIQTLQINWPQFLKKRYGWKLSIEELEYLLWLCSAEQSHPRCSAALTVSVESKEDVQLLRTSLVAQNPRSCTIYRLLTSEHGLRLRHGSQFGALFIGYTDGSTHGDILFFLGPLSPLEETRAARVASSVRKRGEVVFLSEGKELIRYPLAVTVAHPSSIGHGQPKKRHRKD